MSISRLTALTIQNNSDTIVCESGGPNKNGKFVGWISMPNGRTLLNTEAIYDSSKKAISAMQDIVDEINKTDLIAHAANPKKQGG